MRDRDLDVEEKRRHYGCTRTKMLYNNGPGGYIEKILFAAEGCGLPKAYMDQLKRWLP